MNEQIKILQEKIFLTKQLHDNLKPKTKQEKEQKKMYGRLLTLYNFSLANQIHFYLLQKHTERKEVWN